MQKETPEREKEVMETLFRIIGRFDFYISSTNTKASLLLAWNSFVPGFLLLKYDAILGNFSTERWSFVIAISLLTMMRLSCAGQAGYGREQLARVNGFGQMFLETCAEGQCAVVFTNVSR